MELFFIANRQAADVHGRRRTRTCVVRNTYSELKDSTIKTFLEWVPQAVIIWSPVPNAIVKQRLDDGTTLEWEIWFRALDRPEHVRKLLSVEYTNAWLNEAREIPKEILDNLRGRLMRFPPSKDRPRRIDPDNWPSQCGVIMDTNPPDDTHWIYDFFEMKVHEDEEIGQTFKIWHVPKEDNLINLKSGYYDKISIGQTPEWIKVYVEGKYGLVKEGKPVYPEYDDSRHCRFKTDPESGVEVADNYEPVPGLEILVGLDIGMTKWPAAVFGQDNQGLEVFDELCFEDIGVWSFKDQLYEYIQRYYPGRDVRFYGDPAMNSPAIGDKEERTVRQIFSASPNPMTIMPGEVSFRARREAVSRLLARLAEPDVYNTLSSRTGRRLATHTRSQSFFRLSPRCKMLRKGFMGKYQFPELSDPTIETRNLMPVKNMWSHPHDALQYLVTGYFGAHLDNLTSHKSQSQVLPPPSAMAA